MLSAAARIGCPRSTFHELKRDRADARRRAFDPAWRVRVSHLGLASCSRRHRYANHSRPRADLEAWDIVVASVLGECEDDVGGLGADGHEKIRTSLRNI